MSQVPKTKRLLITDHFRERWKERSTSDLDFFTLFEETRPASSSVRGVLKSYCSGVNAERLGKYDDHQFVYWYAKDSEAGLWRFFVTRTKSAGTYTAVTYIELNYKQYYEQVHGKNVQSEPPNASTKA